MSKRVSEPAGRGEEGGVRREAAHFCSMLLAASLAAVNTLRPCPGHISGASFFFFSLLRVSVHVRSHVPLPAAPRVLLVAAECLVLAGLAALTDKQQLQRAGPAGTIEEAERVTDALGRKRSLEQP